MKRPPVLNTYLFAHTDYIFIFNKPIRFRVYWRGLRTIVNYRLIRKSTAWFLNVLNFSSIPVRYYFFNILETFLNRSFDCFKYIKVSVQRSNLQYLLPAFFSEKGFFSRIYIWRMTHANGKSYCSYYIPIQLFGISISLNIICQKFKENIRM